MDFKERILTTIAHEEPDRVPIMSLLNEPAVLNQIENTKSVQYFNYLKKPILRNFMKAFINWDRMWNWDYLNIYMRILNVSVNLGFDASWLLYMIFKIRKDKTFPLGYVWHDVWGRMWDLRVDQFGNPSPFYVRGNLNTEAKWDEWIEKKAIFFDKSIKFAGTFFKKIIDKIGSQIYIVPFAAPGIFENSWQPIGFVEFIKFIYEKPRFIERVVEFQTDYYLKLVEAVCKAGTEIILVGDDLGHKTGPLLNPEIIERLFAPSYKRVAEFVHKQNKKLIFHSCGKIYKLIPKFVEWGFDGLLTLEPTAGMELGKVREMVGHDLVLIGNIDVSYLLVKGTQKEIEDAVKKAIKDAASGGGFILSPAHNHEAVDPKRLQWLVEATLKFGKYPIQL